MNDRRRTAIALLGLVLFTYPVLAIADTGGLTGAAPTIVIYLFVVWAALIALTAWSGRQR